MHRAKLGWKKINLIPLFGFGSTRNGKGTDAGEESAKLADILKAANARFSVRRRRRSASSSASICSLRYSRSSLSKAANLNFKREQQD
ncbi:hypothetical protein MtrunA17_Chr6g0478131 [Medicago truncatula]|uniref:Uncharacterized protein n=1 Tax=Medicago truncatula TaxID=3880 RepID=A0A396HFU9_MEDTR|nr:hypothetical protein MtrunA17_Chr6g0478131 [Medicago truncatula]